MTRCLFIFYLLSFSLYGLAQHPLSNKRMKWVGMADTLVVDTFSILPTSVTLSLSDGSLASPHQYRVEDNIILWTDSAILYDSIQLTYRVLSIDLKQKITHLDTALIAKTYQGDYIGFDFGTSPSSTTSNWTKNNNLQYSGSFARGISFGNGQDLVLNSSFNLQIAGKIGEDTEIIAALTDENIPLQAEGNTQQLNEFDKIYVKINRPNTSLTMGDYELASPRGYFSKYFKKLQGATFHWSSDKSIVNPNWEGVFNEAEFKPQLFQDEATPKASRIYTDASVAIARGKFARNNIIPQEGNQGPYQLQGNEGELFIIVLSGTERVYIDGQLMQRGIEADYIIDYNRGELTFTNQRLITKDSRIIVELDYIDQSFQRSLYAWNTAYESNKLRVYANIFSQQDSKRASRNLELTNTQLMELQTVGDDLQNAFTSSVRPIEEPFNPARIQYVLQDTTYQIWDTLTNEFQIINTTILVYTTTPNDSLVSALFTEVGVGNGNYILADAVNANGRVYQWIAPNQDGQSLGDFEPVQRLSAPERQQLFAVGAEYQINKHSKLQIETALSNTDQNRLSDRDDGDNQGTAIFANYQLQRSLGQTDWTLSSRWQYEYVEKDFRSLTPYRNAEFNRDWDISSSLTATNEHIGRAKIQLNKAEQFLVDYEFSSFFREGIYDGQKHDFLAQYQTNGYDLKVYGSLLNAETTIENTRFFRPRIDASKSFSKWKGLRLGIYGERERNERTFLSTDTLSAASFYWDLYKLYIEKPQDGAIDWHLAYQKRYDFAPDGRTFSNNTIADEIHFRGNWQHTPTSHLGWHFSYRSLNIEQPNLTNQTAQNTYLGRLNYNLQTWRGALRSHTNYEISSGQEVKTTFQYIRVNTGEGIYIWNPTEEYDLNGDSIPQINEFVIAPFRDQANYIRINTFTNEFIRTNNVVFNQSLQWTPRVIWHQSKGWKKVMAHFSTLSTLRILRKVQTNGDESAWNPFALAIADSSLVSLSSNVRNVLYFNQHHAVYDIQLGQSDNRSRNILNTGFESQKNSEQFLRGRWTFNNQWNSIMQLSIGKRERNSETFSNRDYEIVYQKIKPELTYIPNQQWEASFTYEFQNATNQSLEADANAVFHEFQASLQYNKTQKTSFRSELSFVKIDLTGEVNPTLRLTLLEGLQNGKNFLWNIAIDRQIASQIQLRIGYEGRKIDSQQIVHIGSMQIRATF